MEQEDFLYYIEAYYPIEYDSIGRSTTIKIINTVLANKTLEVATSEEGSNFDIVLAIELIALVVETIKIVLEIIDHLKEKKEEATFEKVKKEVLKKLNESEKEKVDSEDIDELIKELLEKMK